jgi:ABC-type branched-subunit amino acid transport system ATPase component/branched-subunit amino acid ABC-type transport system permease component
VSQIFQFAIIGLGAGSLYSIAAIGLVLVYRGSKVVNFAQGAMGMMAAYVFYELHQNWHQSVLVAIPAGLLVSGALGAAFYFLEIRQLKNASNLIKIVATLALFVISQEVIALVFGTQPRIVNSSLPTASVTILGASIGEDRLWIFGIVVVLTVVLWAVYRYTTFGLATTAVAENPTAAATLAISPDLIAVVNWAVGAALGGLAAILLVPITTLSAANLSLIVIPILAAAVIGGFSSFPITTLAGLGMGIAQSEVTRYVSTPGWDTAVPFIAVTLILYFRGRRVAGRDEFFGKLPSVGSGRVPPVLVIATVGVTLLLIWVIFPYDWLVALEYQMIFALIIMSLVVVTGYAGQISLAQMALAGVGALIAAWLYSSYHVPFELALVAGVLAVIPVGVVIALAGVRTRGVALAIVTLGLAFSLEAIVFTNEQFTGGINGFTTDNPHFLGIAVGGLEYPARYATLTLGALVIVGLAIANLRRGRAGRRLIAVRTNERAAGAMGISVSGAKIYAFVLGAMIAALGGVLLVFFFPASDFTSFIGVNSVLFAESAVLGGVGHLGGPLVASSYQPDTLGTQVFSFLGGNVATWLAIAGAALLLVILPTIPDGVAASLERLNAKWLQPLRRRLSRRPASAADFALENPTPVAPPRRFVLALRDVSVTFGGTRALAGLSLEVRSGEVLGLIGPNGAGKTTAIDAITGFVRPTGGRILLGDEEISAWSPERRARAGLVRSFQSLELFDDLSVLENMQAACDSRDRLAYASDLVHPGRRPLSTVAAQAVVALGLDSCLASQARHLSYAQRRLLAVARALAVGGSILLLDEPASGLSHPDAMALSGTICRWAKEHEVGILLIEHNVDMVLRTCDRIVALDFGEVIGQGTPAEIRDDTKVVDAYLGTAKHREAAVPSATAG